MLTDTKLRNLKPRDKLYKVNDREGLYVGGSPPGRRQLRWLRSRQPAPPGGRPEKA